MSVFKRITRTQSLPNVPIVFYLDCWEDEAEVPDPSIDDFPGNTDDFPPEGDLLTQGQHLNSTTVLDTTPRMTEDETEVPYPSIFPGNPDDFLLKGDPLAEGPNLITATMLDGTSSASVTEPEAEFDSRPILQEISNGLEDLLEFKCLTSTMFIHFDAMVQSSTAKMKEITNTIKKTTGAMQAQIDFLAQQQAAKEKVPATEPSDNVEILKPIPITAVAKTELPVNEIHEDKNSKVSETGPSYGAGSNTVDPASRPASSRHGVSKIPRLVNQPSGTKAKGAVRKTDTGGLKPFQF